MRETLLCIGKIGKKPYCFSDTGVKVFSYEEICYYISQHMICYLYTLPDQTFTEYLREELGLERLAYMLEKLPNPKSDQMKYFSTLFREGNYFTEDEIRSVLDEYRKLKNTSVMRQSKCLGDIFMKYNKIANAIQCYRHALRYPADSDIEYGNLYHNLGVARMRLFRHREAQKAFVTAYRYNGAEDSLFYYYLSLMMTEGMQKADEGIESFKNASFLKSTFQERVSDLRESFLASEGNNNMKKLFFTMKNGKEEEASRQYKLQVRELQNSFREQLSVNNNLTKMMKQEESDQKWQQK